MGAVSNWDDLIPQAKAMVLDEMRERFKCASAAREDSVWDEAYLEALNAAIAKLEGAT